MPNVVGVRFKQARRVYYFDPTNIELHVGDWVVVESARGQSLAQVVIAPDQVLASEVTEPLKPVLRKATQEDVERASDIELKEREALLKASELIREMNLPMKMVAAEINLEANHATLFFRSEERVDFRELVRRLGIVLKMRVELRQTGPRDAAKMLGGIGRCGRTLCCATFLSELTPVSIRMAKEQNLPLNPAKISGVCGRLLCCLAFEVETYKALKNKMPSLGQVVGTAEGNAVVVETNPLREAVMVERQDKTRVELPVAELKPREQVEGQPSEEPQPVAVAAVETQKRHRNRRKKKKSAAMRAATQGQSIQTPGVTAQQAAPPVGVPPTPPEWVTGGQPTGTA
ncbi:MAG: stage 0 sporulation family protein [Chloroflexi bacterium]|nr:stage 0 sporulation family protein [Chloroflexota bacterium]